MPLGASGKPLGSLLKTYFAISSYLKLLDVSLYWKCAFRVDEMLVLIMLSDPTRARVGPLGTSSGPLGASGRPLGSLLKTSFAILSYLKLLDVSLY